MTDVLSSFKALYTQYISAPTKTTSAEDEAADQAKLSEELQNINTQMNKISNESLQSTRRMLLLCNEAKEAGINALVTLDEQGEQEEREDEGLEKINKDMKEAEKKIEEMEKCCYMCLVPWKKMKVMVENATASVMSNNNGQTLGGDSEMRPTVQNEVASGGFVTRITNDKREEEMDQNLTEVFQMVASLRNMAVDIGTEVQAQNDYVGSILKKAHTHEHRVKQAHLRATKLI